jgi:hypothetical protein
MEEAALSKIVAVPKRGCEVSGDNDSEQRRISIEATSVFRAAELYYDTVCSLMGPSRYSEFDSLKQSFGYVRSAR